MRAPAMLVACCLAATTLRAQDMQRVTLADALRMAAQSQPTMVQARQSLRLAEAQERQTTANFLPSVSTTASTSRSGGARANQFGSPTTVQGFYNSSIQLSASLDLFTGFRRGAQRASARAIGDEAQATMLSDSYTIALATKQAFFAALADSELVSVSQAQLSLAQEQLNLVTQRLRLGATTRADSLSASVAYGSAEVQLIQARANMRTAQANLGRAIGVDRLVDPVPDTTLEVRLGPLDTATLRREALDNAPAVVAADAAVAAARAQVRVNRAAYFPTVSIGASNSWLAGIQGVQDSTGGFIVPPTGTPFGGNYVSGWNVRLSVTLPLFNNLTRETNMVSSDATYQDAVATARDTRLALDAQLTQSFAALDAAAAQIDVSRTSVSAAEESLRLQNERYRLGAATFTDELNAQVALDQAEVNLVQARYNYLVARAQIEAYVGHGL